MKLFAFYKSLLSFLQVLPRGLSKERPGRQVTVFLILFNISQWMVWTFEMQKVRASPLEVTFFGFMPWLMILRLTMPLVVFFRFHSSVGQHPEPQGDRWAGASGKRRPSAMLSEAS